AAGHRVAASCGVWCWPLLVGVAPGMAFAFKQNVGAFAVMGGCGWILMRPAAISRRWLLAARAVYVTIVAVSIHRLLEPDLDELLALTVWLPLAAGLVLVTVWSSFGEEGDSARASDELTRDGFAFALGRMSTTLAWLMPLMAALGPDSTPFGLFIGQVNQAALRFPLEGL